ncbi:unnamed protein product, partial [Rotaria sordida]
LKALIMTTAIECRDYRNFANDTCNFMRTTPDCKLDDGFINYLTFVFCNFDDKLVALGLTLLAGWLLVLFIGLGVTADSYFCPALRVIARVLRLSENIAGVTFLAFGNGAPDIFSAIAAVGSSKGGDVGLAFGALFGAGVFVTTVVAGTIGIATPFRSIQRPLLRDIIFFIIASFAAYVAMYDGKIYLAESLGFIIMYAVYLIILIGGYFINRQLKDRRALLQAAHTEAAAKTYGSIQTPLDQSVVSVDDTNGDVPDDNYAQPDVTFALSLRHAFLPRDDTPWSERSIINKTFSIIKMPVVIILHFTVPLVDYDKREHNWNKLLNSFHLLSGPLTVSILTRVGLIKIRNLFPVWAVVCIVGTILCFAALILTEYHTKPRYHSGFAFLGFTVSVVWIYSVANEIVNLLSTFGIVFNISNTILGLTFLAWGNSLSDYVSNVVSARQGYPNMGISACYGGPLLNFLMGLGIPFTFVTIKKGSPFSIDQTLLQNVIAYFLFGSLAGTLIFIPLNKFYYSRRFGALLVIYYVVFLVIAILIETNVIDGQLNKHMKDQSSTSPLRMTMPIKRQISSNVNTTGDRTLSRNMSTLSRSHNSQSTSVAKVNCNQKPKSHTFTSSANNSSDTIHKSNLKRIHEVSLRDKNQIDDMGDGQAFDSDSEYDPIVTESDDTFTNEYISEESDSSNSDIDQIQGRISAANIMKKKPGSIIKILDEIALHTNHYAKRYFDQTQRSRQGSNTMKLNSFQWKPLDRIELESFISLLIQSGVNKNNHEFLSELWDISQSSPIYRATMSVGRFRYFLQFIRFDDRQHCDKSDRLSPIRFIFESFVKQLSRHFVPSENLTVDEQLVPFRDCCCFVQYAEKTG